MPFEVQVPTLGESVVEATVGKWLKHEGDQVNAGEALVELETDKVNIEVTAEQSGVLERIFKGEGEDVSIGEVLGVIATNGEVTAAPPQEEQATAAAPAAEQETAAAAPPTTDGREAEAPISPVARRMAEEQGIDIREITGSGPGGRITKEDVAAHLASTAAAPSRPTPAPPPTERPKEPQRPAVPTPPPTMDRREERIRMSRRRQTIAQRLVEAQRTAAMLTTFNEIDMSAVMEIRKRRRDSFRERHGIGLGFMSFFTKATIGALKAFPLLNAEIQGDEIVVKHYYDIGIAVSAEEGLVVPVLRDADRKSFATIEREIADLAKRAREGTLSLPELQGGSFTITNGGVFGSLLSTPILNTPQVGILGMHKIEERPIALNGQVVIRPMMYVALSYDHRIVDGSEAVRFLVRIKELIEDPEALLLEG
jgi:2-oxoglutarate dehydrogenase E2 component (dihydrolipoamide succinyltransferase)